MTGFLKHALRVAIGVLALAGPALADTRTVHARQLVLNDQLSEDTTIEADASLNGEVRITRENGLDCLAIVEAEALVIDTVGCASDEGLRIAVPPGMQIVLNAGGSGDVKIGDIGGRLVLNLTGHGDVRAGRLQGLVLNLLGGSDVSVGNVSGEAVLTLSGSGDFKMGTLSGPLVLKKTSSGDVAIGGITSPSAQIDGSGSGDILIGAGTIGDLRVHLDGSGDFATAAISRDADLAAHGGGDMRVGKVTGTIRRNSGGGSEIRIGSSDLVDGVISEVAHAIGQSGTARTVVSSPSLWGHFATIGIVGFILYLGYRIIRRSGGFARIMQRRSQPQAPAAPTHAGIISVCEMLTRVDQRLGRVEAYVTSREFDLQQKFREMGRS